MNHSLNLQTIFEGHTNWVTAICISSNPDAEILVSASRDKSIIVWALNRSQPDCSIHAFAKSALRGHSHFVQDLAITSDGKFCLSGSWDHTLRLWEVKTGRLVRRFEGHTKDVLSVAFSTDERKIISGSRDKTIRLWNTLGECKYVIEGDSTSFNWISCVRYSSSIRPNEQTATNCKSTSIVIFCGWDKLVKVWDLTEFKLKFNLSGHSGYLNTVTVSPDSSICASGGKDGIVILWDLNEGKKICQLDADGVVNALCFSPDKYWLCAGTQHAIKIWDLETKNIIENIELKDDQERSKRAMNHYCTCINWSADGSALFAGYTDGKIRAYTLTAY